MVSVAEPPAVTDDGLNEAVAPAGRPLADSVTVCAVPAVTAVLTVVVPEPPAVTLADVGDTAIEKSLPATLHVGSLACAGTLTAFQAARTALNSVQLPG